MCAVGLYNYFNLQIISFIHLKFLRLARSAASETAKYITTL